MERMTKTFTCLFLILAVFGIVPMMVSCQQSTSKQKQAPDKVTQTSQPDTNRAGKGGTPAPAVLNQEPQKPSGAVQGRS